jgi:hypothetical protein
VAGNKDGGDQQAAFAELDDQINAGRSGQFLINDQTGALGQLAVGIDLLRTGMRMHPEPLNLKREIQGFSKRLVILDDENQGLLSAFSVWHCMLFRPPNVAIRMHQACQSRRTL